MSLKRPAWLAESAEWHGRMVMAGALTEEEAAYAIGAEIARDPEFKGRLLAEICGHLIDGKTLDEALDLTAENT